MVDLIIMQWNANGIRARSGELRQWISTQRIKPHVICLQETFLKPQHRYELNGYAVERYDRQQGPKGGVATLISTSLSYTVINNTRTNVECISVEVSTTTGKRVITNVYNPAGNDISEADYAELFSRRNAILVGDFNSHSTLWGSPVTDRNGEIIENLLEANGLVALNTGEGTFIKQQGDYSHLDITLTSTGIAAKSTWAVLDDSLGSDHFPVVTTVGERPALQDMSQTKWMLHRADWSLFRERCRSLEYREDLSIDGTYEQLVHTVIDAANSSIPKTKTTTRFRPVPYWNEECSRAIERRNHARNRMNRTRGLEDCIEYRRLKGIAQRTLKDASREHWTNYCSSLTTTTKLGVVWKMAKKMSGTTTQPAMPNLKVNDVSYETNQEKADLLAACYAETSSNRNHSPEFAEKKRKLLEEWRSTQQEETSGTDDRGTQRNHSDSLSEPFSLEELREAIDNSKTHSAPGMDGISYEMIKHLPVEAVSTLLSFYNRLLRCGQLVGAWKEALVIPIPKPGADRSKPESYRPIALTAVLCKLFERLVETRLRWFLEVNSLLNPLQSGFRKQRSTTDQIIRLQDEAHRAIHNKEHTLAVFLDFSKAFDMVWRDGLMYKLRQLGIEGGLYSCIREFLSNRTIQVRVGSAISQKYEMENGTPQGSILSPLLFNVMINDIPSPTDVNTQASIFADDGSAWRSGKNVALLNRKLQEHLDAVADWANTWGFRLSEKKTTAMLISRARHPATAEVTLKVNGVPIPVMREVKFLGVTFDSRLSWEPHIGLVINKCKRATNLLRLVSGQSWGANKKAMLCLYRCLIRSRFDYGCEAFRTASDAQLHRLDVVQNRCLRLCCGAFITTAANTLQQDCGEMPLWLRRKRCILRYTTKVSTNDSNPAVVITREDWRADRGAFEAGKEPANLVIRDYLDQREAVPVKASLPSAPPWHYTPPSTDDSLTKLISKRDNSGASMKALALEVIDRYAASLRIFTDGSKAEDSGRVAAAFYVEELEYGHVVRLSDYSTIFAAELTAVQNAIRWLTKNRVYEGREITVFTDSLSTLQSIRSKRSGSRPSQLASVLCDIAQVPVRVSLVWIPSHVGIPGNEAADRLAKAGLGRPNVETSQPAELDEAMAEIDDYVSSIWQSWYDAQEAGAFYRTLEPLVSTRVKYQHNSRAKETLITRLRFGKCQLNAYLHAVKRHPNGLCTTCRTAETVEHFLLECPQSEVRRALLEKCSELHINRPTPARILSNSHLTDIIYTTLHSQRRRL